MKDEEIVELEKKLIRMKEKNWKYEEKISALEYLILCEKDKRNFGVWKK